MPRDLGVAKPQLLQIFSLFRDSLIYWLLLRLEQRDLERHLASHNFGQSPHTADFRPWKLVAFVGFEDDQIASRFERYLKSSSGRAFAAKHFLTDGIT